MNKYGMLVVGGLLSLGAFAADEGVTLGGYADAGYIWSHQKGDSDVGGFVVREGAVYVGKKFGEWQVFGDFAFGQKFNQNGTLLVSQAFVSTSMDNGLSWKLGKFDGLFGAYAGTVDSWTYRLTDKGLLQGYSPTSHTGWAGSYSLSDMLKVTALVANDSDTKTSDFNGTRNADLGVVVNADLDAVKADVGALFTTGHGAGSDSKLGYLVTANVHGSFSGFDLGVYGLLNKNDKKDAKTDFGFGVNVGHDLTSKLALNVRGEYLNTKSASIIYPGEDINNVAEIAGLKNAMLGTVGAQWKFSNSVVGKLDYSYLKADSASKFEPESTVNAAIVANF
jgi:hypothetical protein